MALAEDEAEMRKVEALAAEGAASKAQP